MRIDPYNPINPITTAPISDVPIVSGRPEVDEGASHDPETGSQSQSSSGQTSAPSPDNLTPDALRSALFEMGINSDGESMQIAESLTRLGLPISENAIADARAILARFPGLPAAAYALAKMIDAPMTPSVLRALGQIAGEALTNNPVPENILDQIAVSLPGSGDPERLVRELYQMVMRLGRSTEQTLSIVADEPDTASRALFHADPRTQLALLLSLNRNMPHALASAIDAHAAHLEGQQLLNQNALSQTETPGQLYFAFPISMGDAVGTLAEILVRRRGDRREGGDAADADEAVLQAVVRVSPPRLGRIEARLTGTASSKMSVGIRVEHPATQRLIQSATKELISGLTRVGWSVRTFTVDTSQEYEPLWTGGAELRHPRHRVDKTA